MVNLEYKISIATKEERDELPVTTTKASIYNDLTKRVE